jgi:hypothetical protein
MRSSHLRIVLAAFGAAALAFAGIFLVADLLGVEPKILTRDPYWAARVSPYYGYVSLVGSTLWLIGSLVALTTALTCRTVLGSRLRDRPMYRMLLAGGLLGSVMAVDDVLLFHDAGADFLRIPEVLFHVVYATGAVALLVFCRQAILRTPWVLLVASFACYAGSSLADGWRRPPMFVKQAEDVIKFSGIVLWAFYFPWVARMFARAEALGREPGAEVDATAAQESGDPA